VDLTSLLNNAFSTISINLSTQVQALL